MLFISHVNIHISGSSVKNFFDNHMDKIMFLIDFIKLPATPVLAQWANEQGSMMARMEVMYGLQDRIPITVWSD